MNPPIPKRHRIVIAVDDMTGRIAAAIQKADGLINKEEVSISFRETPRQTDRLKDVLEKILERDPEFKERSTVCVQGEAASVFMVVTPHAPIVHKSVMSIPGCRKKIQMLVAALNHPDQVLSMPDFVQSLFYNPHPNPYDFVRDTVKWILEKGPR